jgi:hypothetical protein
MFTHAELVQNWKTFAAGALPGVDVIEYDQFDFCDPRNEFHINVYASRRAAFASALRFWVAALAPETDFLRVHGYFTEGSIQDVPFDAYESTVRGLASHLCKPLPEEILFRGKLVEAAKVWLLTGDDAVVATFEDRYVALRFYSTA